MLDYIYQLTLILLKSKILALENVKILKSFSQHYNGRHYITLQNL